MTSCLRNPSKRALIGSRHHTTRSPYLQSSHLPTSTCDHIHSYILSHSPQTLWARSLPLEYLGSRKLLVSIYFITHTSYASTGFVCDLDWGECHLCDVSPRLETPEHVRFTEPTGQRSRQPQQPRTLWPQNTAGRSGPWPHLHLLRHPSSKD